MKRVKPIVFLLATWSIMVAIGLASSVAEQYVPNPNESVDKAIGAVPFGIEAVTPLGNVISIPPADFTSDGNDPDGYYHAFAGGYFAGTLASNACLAAPVHFPKGSTMISKVYIFAKDANATNSEEFHFFRINQATGVTEHLGGVSTVDSAGVVKYEIPISKKIISAGYAYEITTCARLNIYVYGARVTYQTSP